MVAGRFAFLAVVVETGLESLDAIDNITVTKSGDVFTMTFGGDLAATEGINPTIEFDDDGQNDISHRFRVAVASLAGD